MDYKFSIKNFKTFGANGKAAEFVIKPITILTGPNNSGKSNLAKFIEFVKNNIDVMAPNINLKKNKNDEVRAEDITTKGKNYEKMEFSIQSVYKDEISLINSAKKRNQFKALSLKWKSKLQNKKLMNMIIKIELIKNNDLFFLDRIAYYHDNNLIAQFKLEFSGDNSNQNEPFFHYFFNLKHLYDIGILNLDDKTIVDENANLNLKKLLNFSDFVLENDNLFLKINKEYLNEALMDYENVIEDSIEINNISGSMNVTSQLYNNLYKGFNLDYYVLENFSDDIFLDFIINYLNLREEEIETYKFTRNNELDNELLIPYFMEIMNKIFKDSFNNLLSSLKKFFHDLNDAISSPLNQFVKISLDRILNQKYYQFSKDHDKLNLIGLSIFEKKPDQLNFVNNWLKKLNIVDEINIQNVGDIIKINLNRNDIEVDISQLGKGSQLLIPLIIMLQSKESGFIYIEEPESNLHPSLQSKLAEFFVESIFENPERHLLIETHSEYLIRKLQVLVAKGEISKDLIKIYYLHDDPTREDYITELEMDDNGFLLNEFGEGFIDEGAKLITDLWKIERNN